MVKVREDMTGWKMWEHGVPDSRLTVIERADDLIQLNGQVIPQYLCECSCGKHTKLIVRGSSVKNGSTKSCGCLRNERMKKAHFVDMTGWVMSDHGVPDSRLTVKSQAPDYIGSDGARKTQWYCGCNCGNSELVIASSSSLKAGLVKSCGCLHREQSAINGQNNKKYNQVVLNLEDEHGLYGVGYCSNTNREFYFDMDDYDKIKNYCWCENKMKNGYCRLETHDKDIGQSIIMHWLIIGKSYDHADRNPMNNRKYNLRPATAQENARNHSKQKNNTSGFTGVSFVKRNGQWLAYIVISKQRKYLGYFADKKDAIVARLKAEIQYFGADFAPQRHLFNEYNIS